MDKKNMLRWMALPFVVGAIGVIPMSACDQIADAQQTLCCSEFIPGNDLSAVDWKLEGQANVNYGALMQAMADFSATATSMVSDVANACQAIATDLGADPNAVKDTRADLRAQAWCQLAINKINEKAGQATIQLDYQPPQCTVNASLQAGCEARCSGKVECEVTPAQIRLRCDPAKLSGKCSGTCSAQCEGSANLAVTCEGVCQGACEGACSGTCDNQLGNQCNGRCNGTCSGKCRGTCDVSGSAGVACEGQCTGGCDVEVQAPKCKGELSPPSADCNAELDCNAACKASASAKIDCTEPSLTINASAGIQDVLATLSVNLPKLLAIAEGKAPLAIENAQAIIEISGAVSFDSTKAVACLVPASTAIAQALTNIQASLSASLSVTAAVSG